MGGGKKGGGRKEGFVGKGVELAWDQKACMSIRDFGWSLSMVSCGFVFNVWYFISKVIASLILKMVN